MKRITEFFDQLTDWDLAIQQKVLLSIFIIIGLWLVHKLIDLISDKRGDDDLKKQYYWRKTIHYSIVATGFLLIGNLWIQNFQSITTFLGLVSAGLVIALKDIFVNISGWAFILWRQPFEVGDRVEISGVAGDVIDIRLFRFSMIEIGNWVDADQSTGRVIHMPNGKVFTEPIANYSTGFNYIWHEIPVYITFESDWKKAKSLLNDIAFQQMEHISKPAADKIKEASKKYMIVYKKLTPKIYTSVGERGVKLTIRYLCDPRTRRGSEEGIWEAVLEAFSKAPDIKFAYPTQRLYMRNENDLESPPEE